MHNFHLFLPKDNKKKNIYIYISIALLFDHHFQFIQYIQTLDIDAKTRFLTTIYLLSFIMLN